MVHRTAVLFSCIAVVALVSTAGACKKSSPSGGAPVVRMAERLEPPGWADGEALQLRADPGNKHVLWLRRYRTRQPGLVYRVDCTTGRVTTATEDEWNAADSEVRDCADPHGWPRGWYCDSPSGKLKDVNGFVPTAAEYLVGLAWFTGSRYVGVLSADGPTRGGYIGLSTLTPLGQHYHQTFSLDAREPVGEPVRLPFDRGKGAISACFAPRQGCVMYYTTTGLCIIELDCERE
jgi:hypothetical protein